MHPVETASNLQTALTRKIHLQTEILDTVDSIQAPVEAIRSVHVGWPRSASTSDSAGL